MLGTKKALIHVGIIKYGLKAIGAPKNNGSLILKIDGTITAFPIAFSCKDLLKMSIIMDSDKVVPTPPIEINAYTVSCVAMFDALAPFATACEFSASPAI